MEKDLTWSQPEGYSHTTLDDGEEKTGKHKMSPILFPNGTMNNQRVLQMFQENSKQLDQVLVDFISTKIKECSSDIK